MNPMINTEMRKPH